MQSFRVAILQMCSGPDKDANLDAVDAAAAEAAQGGARLLALPEVFSFRDNFVRERAGAEAIGGPTSRRLSTIARSHGLFISGGSILEDSDEPNRVFNTSILVDPAGEIISRYRKIHLFDVDMGDRITARESDHRIPGDEVIVAETSLACFGLSVCYDLRFPELYRQHVAVGAEILLVPSAFTATTGVLHWETLLRARAIENQCFVIAANQHGHGPHGHNCHGHSMVVDPWGEILAEASDGDCLFFADLDADRLASYRARIPALSHRRL